MQFLVMIHTVDEETFLNEQIADRKKMCQVQNSEENSSIFEWLMHVVTKR
jgi:hypothetical protein